MAAPLFWKCDVCGYIHNGSEPPDTCPVCGVSSDNFSPFDIAVKTPATSPLTTTRWRCTICDYIHEGETPPEECPVCGAGPDLFEPIAERTTVVKKHGESLNIVIIGGGVAGLTAAEHARRADDAAIITIVTREEGLPYYRLNLTRYLAGQVEAKNLDMHDERWFLDNAISLRAGEATKIDRDRHVLHLSGGLELPWDRLIIAGGAHPFVPPLPGATREGVLSLRTLVNADRIIERAGNAARVVLVGGGLLGLETAGALARRGCDVTVLEGFQWLLPRQLTSQAGELLQRNLESIGIQVRCGVSVKEICGDESVRSLRLESGEEIPTDMVIMATGVRPNSYLARTCDLKVRNGVIVDDRMQTSDPLIYAAGDVTEHRGIVYGIWPAAFAQGAVAGTNAVGGQAEFPGMPHSTRLKVLDVDVFSIGLIHPTDASYQIIHHHENGSYVGLVCHDGRIEGASVYGTTNLAGLLKEAVENNRQIVELTDLIAAIPPLQTMM